MPNAERWKFPVWRESGPSHLDGFCPGWLAGWLAGTGAGSGSWLLALALAPGAGRSLHWHTLTLSLAGWWLLLAGFADFGEFDTKYQFLLSYPST